MILDTHVKDMIYPKVEASLKDKSNISNIINHISKYIDRNNGVLFSLNFSNRLILSGPDKDIIFSTLGITEDEISEIIKQSKYISKIPWVSNPFTVSMALIIRYFSIYKMQKEVEVCIIYLSCLFYILMHTRSFPHLPNREIMDYTLNKNPNITNSFIIKKEGTIFGMIKYTGITSHEFYIDDLIKDCTDVQINRYLSAIRTRIGSNMKNLAKYFHQDHKANNYLNKDTDSFEEENFHMTDSTTLSVARLASKTATNVISYKFNKKFINNCANLDISVYPGRLTQILENIIENHRKDLERFISLILEIYVMEGNNIREVSSLKFLTHSLNIYKTNSTQPKVIEVKEFLDKWIEESSVKYGNRIVRTSTLNSYRKCIFMVFVYTINSEA